MQTVDTHVVRAAVRKTYGDIASGSVSTECCNGAGCCGPAEATRSRDIGYSEMDLSSVPDGADLGLGCGNPQTIASLKPGERVLDLGSGGGFDVFLAARQVGPGGRVVGVDMTAEMVAKARANAANTTLDHVEFRLGAIEQLPVADESVDVIMSNCVVNLSPDKAATFREAFRVLVPGGRLAIADIVALTPLPASGQEDLPAYVGCVAGAALVADLQAILEEAGFGDVRIEATGESRTQPSECCVPGLSAEDDVASALIQAVKPGRGAPRVR